MAVISPSCFSMYTSNLRIDAPTLFSMLASPFPPSFLHTYSLSTSSLGCYTLCIVISFLVLWPICKSPSLVYFKKGPQYQTRGTAQVCIPLIRFLQDSFVLSCFLGLLRYSFFFSFQLVWWYQPQRCTSIRRFPYFFLTWGFYSVLQVSFATIHH